MPMNPPFESLNAEALDQVTGGGIGDPGDTYGLAPDFGAGAYQWLTPPTSDFQADFCGSDASCWDQNLLQSLPYGADW
jgi:hypothetical protein